MNEAVTKPIVFDKLKKLVSRVFEVKSGGGGSIKMSQDSKKPGEFSFRNSSLTKSNNNTLSGT